MTAEEWDASTDYEAVWRPLVAVRSTRRWYCFGLACVRLLWEQLPFEFRHAIEVTERYVERKASNSDRANARPRSRFTLPDPEEAVYWATCAPNDVIEEASRRVPIRVRRALTGTPSGTLVDITAPASRAVDEQFIRFLREVFPNPYRDVRIDPAWLRWSDGAVRRIAETILDEGDFTRVGVLGDALEEAGCTDEYLLGHLRSPGPHCLGCWAVDLVLGKK